LDGVSLVSNFSASHVLMIKIGFDYFLIGIGKFPLWFQLVCVSSFFDTRILFYINDCVS